jgi:hypothetical protein
MKLEKTIEERKGKTDIDDSGKICERKVINKRGQHTQHITHDCANKIKENKEPHGKTTKPK